MKKLLSANQYMANRDIVMLFVRVTIAALMLSHGIPKLVSLFSGNVQFPSILGLSAELSLSLAVFAEVICSLFILFGVATRFATIPLIITMLIAVFHFHAADPFAKQELGLMYLLAYVILFFTGSGKYSIDYLVQRKPAKAVVSKQKRKEEPTLSM